MPGIPNSQVNLATTPRPPRPRPLVQGTSILLAWLSSATLRAFPRAGPHCDHVFISGLVQREKEDPGQYWLNCDFLMRERGNGCGVGHAPEKVQGATVSASPWVPLSPSGSRRWARRLLTWCPFQFTDQPQLSGAKTELSSSLSPIRGSGDRQLSVGEPGAVLVPALRRSCYVTEALPLSLGLPGSNGCWARAMPIIPGLCGNAV